MRNLEGLNFKDMYKKGDKFKVGTKTDGSPLVMEILQDHSQYGGEKPYFCKIDCCMRMSRSKEELDKLEKIN